LLLDNRPDLVGLEYEPLYEIKELQTKNSYKVVPADFVIKCALQMKDRSAILPLLDDTVELNAHKAIAKRMGIEI